MPALLRLAANLGLEAEIDLDNAVYYISHGDIEPTSARNMARWRKRLFAAMARNSASPVDYFCLPLDRTVTVGIADRVLGTPRRPPPANRRACSSTTWRALPVSRTQSTHSCPMPPKVLPRGDESGNLPSRPMITAPGA